jgi:hypothetical protein
MSSESKNGKVAEMPSVNHAASDGGLMMTHDGIELANTSVAANKGSTRAKSFAWRCGRLGFRHEY